ncbi:MAG: hypothetical protein ACF8OB_01410 [Phycisphaeraceae bacterium JB051]
MAKISNTGVLRPGGQGSDWRLDEKLFESGRAASDIMATKEIDMKNLDIFLPLVNGGSQPLDFEAGHEIIEHMVGDDLRPPATCLVIQAIADDGTMVSITIPNDSSGEVGVRFEKPDEQ